MYALGYSLDNLSLMGLTIATGFVVDDAIVMIENIVPLHRGGRYAAGAAIKGSGQIGFTIVSISCSLIAVFIPLLFMGGIIGRLFREFAMVVTISVVASAFIALTLTPMMCALFLRRESGEPKGRWNQMAEGFFDGMLRGYDRGLRWVFDHQLITLEVTLALIMLTGLLYVWIPKGFFPEQDTGFIYAQAQARQDSSFEAMVRNEQALAAILQADPARLQASWASSAPPAAIPARTWRACSRSSRR